METFPDAAACLEPPEIPEPHPGAHLLPGSKPWWAALVCPAQCGSYLVLSCGTRKLLCLSFCSEVSLSIRWMQQTLSTWQQPDKHDMCDAVPYQSPSRAVGVFGGIQLRTQIKDDKFLLARPESQSLPQSVPVSLLHDPWSEGTPAYRNSPECPGFRARAALTTLSFVSRTGTVFTTKSTPVVCRGHQDHRP